MLDTDRWINTRPQITRQARRMLFLSMLAIVATAIGLPAGANGQPPLWTSQFGTSAFDAAVGVASDSGGNVYVAGRTEGALPGQAAAGELDAYIRKYDRNGRVVWTRQFGTPFADDGRDVAVDPGGNVFVVGLTAGILPDQTSAGNRDAYVRKYDRDGAELWTRQFGTSERDRARGVAAGPGGDVYVVGDFGNKNVGFVRKYDRDGEELWTRQLANLDTAPFVRASDVAIDSTGNVYVAGLTAGILPDQTSDGDRDAFVRKYDPDGDELWTRQFGSSGSDTALGVALDPGGNVYVAGRTNGELPGQTSTGPRDAFVRKYGPDGDELWTRQFGTSGDDDVREIAVDAEGNVYVGGQTSGILPGQTSAGDTDAFVRKYDSNGDEQWTRQFGSSGRDRARAVALDSGGNVYVAGETRDALPGQTSVGGNDAFVRKYDRDGNTD